MFFFLSCKNSLCILDTSFCCCLDTSFIGYMFVNNFSQTRMGGDVSFQFLTLHYMNHLWIISGYNNINTDYWSNIKWLCNCIGRMGEEALRIVCMWMCAAVGQFKMMSNSFEILDFSHRMFLLLILLLFFSWKKKNPTYSEKMKQTNNCQRQDSGCLHWGQSD